MFLFLGQFTGITVKIRFIAKIGRSIQLLSRTQVPDTLAFNQETQGVPSRV